MLGLGNSLSTNYNLGEIKMLEGGVPNTSQSTGLVGWYDFSDVSTISKSADGSTNQPSNGEGFLFVHNKVTHVNRMGDGLGTTATSNSGVYTTGGANSKSYVDMDDDFLTLKNATNFGWNPPLTVFDGYAGTTIFAVIDPANANVSDDRRLFNLWTNEVGTTTSNLIAMDIVNDGSDDEWSIQVYDGSGPTQAHDTNIDNATGAQLWTLGYRDTGDPATAGIFYKDGDSGSAYTIDLSDTGAHDFTISNKTELRNTSGSGSADKNFTIGHNTNSGGLAVGDYWVGKVYEFLNEHFIDESLI